QEARRDQEAQRHNHIEPVLGALAEEQVEDLDPHMLVALEGVGSTKHHEDGEHVPLRLEPAVRRVVEGVADHRVRGADQAGQQYEQVTDVADLLVELIDGCTQSQQWTHYLLRVGAVSWRADYLTTIRPSRRALARVSARLSFRSDCMVDPPPSCFLPS